MDYCNYFANITTYFNPFNFYDSFLLERPLRPLGDCA